MRRYRASQSKTHTKRRSKRKRSRVRSFRSSSFVEAAKNRADDNRTYNPSVDLKQKAAYFYNGNFYSDEQLMKVLQSNSLHSKVRVHQVKGSELVPVVFVVDRRDQEKRWDDIHNTHNWERLFCTSDDPVWMWSKKDPPTQEEYDTLNKIMTNLYGDPNVFVTGGLGNLTIIDAQYIKKKGGLDVETSQEILEQIARGEIAFAKEIAPRPPGFLGREKRPVNDAIYDQVVTSDVIEAMETVRELSRGEAEATKEKMRTLRDTLVNAFRDVPKMLGTPVVSGNVDAAHANLETPLLKAWWAANDMIDWLGVQIRKA